MKKETIWVLVADSAEARIFERSQTSGHLLQVKEMKHAHESTHEHGRDKPGRSHEGGPNAYHAYEPQTDWHLYQKELFSKELADTFVLEHQEKKFQRAYIICPPVMMGHLRHFLTPYLNKLIAENKPDMIEITKDMAHHELKDIEKLVGILT